MKTQIEDDQLLSELEDLYLSSKHWLSDLEFLERNLEFLQKLYGKAFYQLIKQNNPDMITQILTTVSKVDKDHTVLKNEIINYLHTLESLIKDPEINFSISIVIVHADLENRLNKLFDDFKFIKKIVSDFARWSLKSESIIQVLLDKHLNSPEFKVFVPLFSCMDDGDFTEEELEHFCYSTDDTRN